MDDVVDDIDQKQRAERQQLRDDSEVLTRLLAHEGWKTFLLLVDKVAQNHHATIMKPAESLLEMPRIEFAKGVLSGLSLAMALPMMKIHEARELIPPQPYEED